MRTATPRGAVSILPIQGIPEVLPGDDLAEILLLALERAGAKLADGDVLVVASKVVSKAMGRQVRELPAASDRAVELAAVTGFDAGFVELILTETREVLRARPRVLVVETVHGLVCANAGVDRSNTGGAALALLLPVDSDAIAAHLRERLGRRHGARVAVLVSDTFGRPFRHGLVNVAIGVAGMAALRDYRGQADPDGRLLEGTELAVADELCSAAELVMNKLDRVPLVLVRGYDWEPAETGGGPLLRDREQDYFR